MLGGDVRKKSKNRKLAAARHRGAAAELFDVFAAQAPIGIFANDARGRCVYVNALCCEKLGTPAEALLGDGWARRVHPDDRPRVEAAWREAVAGSGLFEDEYRFCRPDGSIIWAQCRIVRLSAPAARGIRYLGTLVDTTARRLAETRLQESRDRIQAVLDASPAGIVSLDRDARVLAWNRGAEHLFGWSEAEVMGQRCPAFPPGEREAFQALIGRVIGGAAVSGEVHECRNRLGQPVRVALSLRRLSGSGREPAGVVVLCDDLTVYERMLGQLRELVATHERMVQDLHDTCIQSIYAVGLRLEECRRLVTANPARAIGAIGAAAADLNLVIQDLRAFISQGGSDKEARDFRSEVERMVAAPGARGPAFVVDIDAAAVAALQPAQAAQLLHIVREGISNVIRHARARKARVALRLTPRRIRLEIADDGRGFDRRAGSRRALGLHHMRARVARLKGRWHLVSAPGRGTRLFVDLRRPA